MKRETIFKSVSSALLLASVLSPVTVSAEIVKIMGSDNKVLGAYSASSVDHIEFAEGNVAEITANSIVIPLSDTVKFKMIKVEGGVDYTLTNQGAALTAGEWANGGATKQMEDFWIGEFEVTQGIWKEVMGVADAQLPVSNQSTTVGSTTLPSGSKQTKIGDNYPIANVSWDDICTGSDSFLVKINARLKELKESDPVLAAVLGDREFRLPNEWEWAYAAAGGKNYATLNYYYSGTSESTNDALNKVAVNSVTSTLSSVAEVGSKEPNALGLYDMSGNVWERCSGLGYPGQETTFGYLKVDGTFESSYRPRRGGGWAHATISYFWVWGRSYSNSTGYRNVDGGFRLAL